NKKVLAMSQIRASIKFSRLKKQINICDTMFNQFSAPPIGETNYRHPAVDDRAKWELNSIFNVQFLKPNYMDTD
ncbi:13104_t:CDS:2, partial [Gigaspora rosea]